MCNGLYSNLAITAAVPCQKTGLPNFSARNAEVQLSLIRGLNFSWLLYAASSLGCYRQFPWDISSSSSLHR